MITAKELKNLAVKQDIYHISTEDFKGKFKHNRDWLAKNGYSENPKSEKQKQLQYSEYQNALDGAKAAPVFCSFWHWSLAHILGEIDNGSIVSINWQEALDNAIEMEKEKPGSNDWTTTICQYGVAIFGNQDYKVLVEW